MNEVAQSVPDQGVNRRPKLTPDRRSKLTPFLVVARSGSARPGGAGRGCAAGASADRFAVPRGKQGESPASIRMRIAGVLARRREGEARA